MKKHPFILSGLLLLTITGFSQSLKTKSVTIFKNGTAFFQKNGTINSKDKVFNLGEDEIPEALFGTLGFVTPGESIVSIRSFDEYKKKQYPLQNMHSILAENKGKEVKISAEEIGVITGKIISASENQVAIQSDKGWHSIMMSTIKGIEFIEQPNFFREGNSSEQIISLGFNKEVSNQELDMFYLSEGLGWFPTYLLELTGEKTATLTLNAEMVNDGEDLENVDVDFVVGVPNFAFANFESPLTGGLDLDDIINGLAGGGGNRRDLSFSNNLQNVQVISYSTDRNLRSDEITDIANSVEGKAQEDLFFYSLKNITLPEDGRAEFQILKAEVPIEHIYEANLQANNASRSYFGNLINQKKNSDIFHKIKVNNSTKQPFTTGPTMVVKKDGDRWAPISQDKLNYTPTGGHSFLKVTTAPDISIVHEEEEVTRQENAKRKRKTVYDLLTVKGEVTVKNYKEKDIHLNARRAITGKLGTTSEKWLTSPAFFHALRLILLPIFVGR